MNILIVDDSKSIRLTIKKILNSAGYTKLFFADSAAEAFMQLGIESQDGAVHNAEEKMDLIILDIVMPDIDGLEACRRIKSVEFLQDIPIIMVTALTEVDHLENAFAAGAMDFINKPLNEIELLARIRSALKLKQEMNRRKAREQELLEVTKQLEKIINKLNQLSSLEGVTGAFNRRRFDLNIESEWKRCRRNTKPLSLIIADIDFFKDYNDTYGHLAGDNCLKKVVNGIQEMLKRPGDNVYRYGGEEFAVILPETPKKGAIFLAESMCSHIEALSIVHESSQVSRYVTTCFGVSTTLPDKNMSPRDLIAAADKALYAAKNDGRNRVEFAGIENTCS